jgi:5-methylcytosine-specific restriction endonuclease McrA
MREKVFARDGGVCAICQRDTIHQQHRYHLKTIQERARLRDAGADPDGTVLEAWQRAYLTQRQIPWTRRDKMWFDCDHIVPLLANGVRSLSNLQTTCVKCHKAKTKADRKRKKQ